VAQNDKGLTLIEVLAAVTILSILILIFTNVSASTSKSSSQTDKKSVALRLAEIKMNKLRNEIYTAGIFPYAGSQDSISTDSDGFQTDVYDVLFTDSPAYLIKGLANKVFLTDIFVMNNISNQEETRLLVVAVSWAG
jgi:prepilin-type N-terminal cleavage/methylation domain-containing protein